MRICVYGAASDIIDKGFIKDVEKLGGEMVKRGHSLVFGGGSSGLMGAVARGVHAEDGHVLGVIPTFFEEDKIEAYFTNCDQLIRPETMRERKQIMEDNADAFIIVPGGIGTFEEFFEILTLKQLLRHNKPIAIYNLQNYYDELLVALQTAVDKNFIRNGLKELFFVTKDMEELFRYVEQPPKPLKSVQEYKNG